ncbi:MAG: GNAT family N-acetyltransferase [Nakamurella sp.]
METILIRRTGYDDPDVQLLVAEVQLVYLERYGHQDHSPIAAAEFDPPDGTFLLAAVDGMPAAMGGWRRHLLDDGAAAEVRRMYVSPQFRGRGLARAVLAELETTARDNGYPLMILETGVVQPEALELYRSSGYRDVPPFGHYAGSPLSVCLGKRL